MIRKALGVAAMVGIGALVASQWQDLKRLVKIREISRSGNPELVPVHGRAAYPTASSKEPAAAKNDFDPPHRGAPAR